MRPKFKWIKHKIGGNCGCHQHDQHRRHKSTKPSQPEIAETKQFYARLSQYKTSNQITGYDKKYINADESSAKQGKIKVISHYTEDGDRSQAINIRPVAVTPHQVRVALHVCRSALPSLTVTDAMKTVRAHQVTGVLDFSLY